eukprot:3873467-Amphidinium_carterae.1
MELAVMRGQLQATSCHHCHHRVSELYRLKQRLPQAIVAAQTFEDCQRHLTDWRHTDCQLRQ